MTLAKGQDRSDFQPVTPWTGLDFGFTKATEGLGWQAQTFKPNWANLAAEGKHRGAYHFLHPSLDGPSQAKFFFNFVESHGGWRDGDMVAVDSELLSGVRNRSARSHTGIDVTHLGLVSGDVDSVTKAFLDECAVLFKGIDREVVLTTYTMHEVGQHLVSTAAAYPNLWFAWPSSTEPSLAEIAPFKEWKFWQNAWVPVDEDRYHGDAAELTAWIKSLTVDTRKTVVYTTDGTKSLAEICNAHGDHMLSVINRTLLHGPHPRLVAYVAEHPAGHVKMPKDIKLYLRETV